MEEIRKKTQWHSGNRIWRRELVAELKKQLDFILLALLDEGIVDESDLTDAGIEKPDDES